MGVPEGRVRGLPVLDMSSFQAAAASLQAAGGIVKAILDLRDSAAIHAKVMELNSVILDAQSHAMSAQATAFTQVERIRDLEQRLVQMENWEREKERYELHEVISGVLTYALKETMRSGEPSHQICAKCYHDGVKSILQEETLAVGRTHVLICHRCGSELITQGLRQEEHPRPRRR